ncbi:uncharacterized protein Z520_06132 [Fonsecaea multimorphosa CBS 102226]|uniref:Protein-lysine N-methyltransferase EFM4 n=1 Tax=Fonsecaea multimorphosa CBS 102226 TaxID=1442371 RepID=A0A0D2KMY4_9EURO|nr:uncharacterized protein Z520_06132 [Fonsecaea multimorphosa CBS 102226]KIX98053.1 hypothetical protein Z520_06132 [Fonsecaea multimorphosa CBS 102226]OAL24419.1 hypothetical protein AYO22_05795 [Fonsecaea multimorphosa]
MSAEKSHHPAHLEPSELGTKEYWDEYYQNDLENGVGVEDEDGEDDVNVNAGNEAGNEEPPDPSELDSWFDDVGAPAKTLAFLTSTTFPLSPNYIPPSGTSTQVREGGNAPAAVLDLGTGNGSALFALRLHGGYAGRMVGVDYSSKSVELARKLCAQYSSSYSSCSTSSNMKMENIDFHVLDIIHDSPASQPWWPDSGFDLVLDKGTFDAISLSSATVSDDHSTNRPRRICELYPSKVLQMVKTGGFLLVTSCNWTEAEVVSWFTTSSPSGSGRGRGSENNDPDNGTNSTTPKAGISEEGAKRVVFEVYDTIKYPVFEFGGQKGQGVASVCFRKILQTRETNQG